MAVAGVLFDMGGDHREAATALVMKLLQRDEANPRALYHYARIALDRGMVKDALLVLLRLLVNVPGDTHVR